MALDYSKDLIFDIFEKVNGRSDLDWIEIRDKYSLECASDTLRKAGVGIKMAADAGCISLDSSTDKPYAEIYKAKQQFYDERRAYNRELVEEARADRIESALIECARKMNQSHPVVHTAYRESTAKVDMREAVVVWSDWHYGLTAHNIWNDYNTEISHARMNKCLRETLWKLAENNVDVVHVVLLGDLISGGNYSTLRIEASESIVQQVMDVCEMIATYVSKISESYKVIVHTTFGNHARIIQNKRDSIHSDNLECLIPFWLNQRFYNADNVQIEFGDGSEIVYFKTMNHAIAAVHGDLDDTKSKAMSTLPVLCQKKFGERPEVVITGHFHHAMMDEVLDITQVGVGSLIGTDSYAKDKRMFSKPSQTVLIFDDDGLDSVHNIDLSKPERQDMRIEF